MWYYHRQLEGRTDSRAQEVASQAEGRGFESRFPLHVSSLEPTAGSVKMCIELRPIQRVSATSKCEASLRPAPAGATLILAQISPDGGALAAQPGRRGEAGIILELKRRIDRGLLLKHLSRGVLGTVPRQRKSRGGRVEWLLKGVKMSVSSALRASLSPQGASARLSRWSPREPAGFALIEAHD